MRGRGAEGIARLASDIFPAAEALHLERTFERFSWTCVLEAARALPAESLLFLNVNPRLIERSENALVALGEEMERRAIPFSRLVIDLVEVELDAGAPSSRRALTVPRDLGAVIALDDVTSGYGPSSSVTPCSPSGSRWIAEVTRGIAQDPRRRAILKFLADLGRRVLVHPGGRGDRGRGGSEVCAAEGVAAAQGYFLARPAAEPPRRPPRRSGPGSRRARRHSCARRDGLQPRRPPSRLPSARQLRAAPGTPRLDVWLDVACIFPDPFAGQGRVRRREGGRGRRTGQAAPRDPPRRPRRRDGPRRLAAGARRPRTGRALDSRRPKRASSTKTSRRRRLPRSSRRGGSIVCSRPAGTPEGPTKRRAPREAQASRAGDGKEV